MLASPATRVNVVSAARRSSPGNHLVITVKAGSYSTVAMTAPMAAHST